MHAVLPGPPAGPQDIDVRMARASAAADIECIMEVSAWLCVRFHAWPRREGGGVRVWARELEAHALRPGPALSVHLGAGPP